MTHLSQLNTSFKSILSDPFNQEAWADFDLTCIYLSKDGYTFLQQENEFNCSFKTVVFKRKQQSEYINKIEIKRALDLQFFDYLNQLLFYKRDVLSKWWKAKRKIKVYEGDYFIKKEGEIFYKQSGHPLIDLKVTTILERRTGMNK